MKKITNDKAFNQYWDKQTDNAINQAWETLRWLRSLDYPNPPEEAAISALYNLIIQAQTMRHEIKVNLR